MVAFIEQHSGSCNITETWGCERRKSFGFSYPCIPMLHIAAPFMYLFIIIYKGSVPQGEKDDSGIVTADFADVSVAIGCGLCEAGAERILTIFRGECILA